MRLVNRQSPQPGLGALAIGSWLLSTSLSEMPLWGWPVLLLVFGWARIGGQRWLGLVWFLLLGLALGQQAPLGLVWGMAGAGLWGIAGRSPVQPLGARIPVWVLGLWVLLS
ncbi:MAG: hypothetical protein SNJ60_03465, partial [Pseudanabaenaceae cyanobacterium]